MVLDLVLLSFLEDHQDRSSLVSVCWTLLGLECCSRVPAGLGVLCPRGGQEMRCSPGFAGSTARYHVEIYPWSTSQQI